ncbi:MAG TPA: glycosyl transferase [Sphingobacteriaceae bacterium]|nr:glycosyl transferase [Sphingobacteriaceae bacterium]
MRILYAIQGTGNGHISRAREIIPLLQRYGHVDTLVSGTQADVSLNEPVTYKLHGFSLIFGKNGGVDYWTSYKIMNLAQLYRDIRSLPLHKYDLIINDFEPVTAWACKLQGRPSVALSHQSSFLSKKTPRPSKNFNWAEWVFQFYAPTTHKIGFHFERYDDFIHTPIIRSEIRNQETSDLGHVTVYLPAYDDKIIATYLKQVPDIKWEVFTKHSKVAYRDANVQVEPVNNKLFKSSLASASGLLTGGGFEGPAEALFLKKKVIIFPMRNQYEQQCNAEAARRLGIQVVKQLDTDFVPQLKNWLAASNNLVVNFPDETETIIDNLMKTYSGK